MTPNKSSRPITRPRYIVLAAAASLMAASCGQSQSTANATTPESSAAVSTEQTSGDAVNDTTATAEDLGSVPAASSDSTAESIPAESSTTEAQSETPAEAQPNPEPVTPAALPNIAMTDVGAGSPFNISQLSGGQGDILLWFYLPT